MMQEAKSNAGSHPYLMQGRTEAGGFRFLHLLQALPTVAGSEGGATAESACNPIFNRPCLPTNLKIQYLGN